MNNNDRFRIFENADDKFIERLKDSPKFTDDEKERIKAMLPDVLPYEVAETVIAYCNKPDDSDYVILPVSNFDAYFGNTSFSHKWLILFPDTILERDKQSFGVCRIKINTTEIPHPKWVR